MLRDSKKLPDYLQEYRKNYTFAAELMIKPYGSTVKPGNMAQKNIHDEVSLQLNAFELLAIQSYLRYAKKFYDGEYDTEKINGLLAKCEALEKEYK